MFLLRFEYHTFYVLCPFVTYLLALPRIFPSSPRGGGEEETRRRQRESNRGRPTRSQRGGRGTCLHSEPAVKERVVVGGGGISCDVYIRGHPSGDPRIATAASTLAGCRAYLQQSAAIAMETGLFVAISCLLLHLGDQSTIRKSVL
jgi:hypothetical protein